MSDRSLTFDVQNFWKRHDPGTDPIATQLIVKGLTLANSKRDSDVTLASVFGRRTFSSAGNVVMFSGEPRFRDEFARYTIDCRFRGHSDHLRLPLWAYLLLRTEELPTSLETVPQASKFCNFIYSNDRCQVRNAFFEMLNAEMRVDSLGSVMSNAADPRLSACGHSGWRETKIDVLRDYRFTIAFENHEILGYTTEKMVDAWLAGSVPIYWGNPAVALDFPIEGCLSLYEAGSMTRLVDQVMEAEREPERYVQLQAANPFRTGAAQQRLEKYRSDLSSFIEMVVEDTRSRTSRYPRGSSRQGIHRQARRLQRCRVFLLRVRRRLFSRRQTNQRVGA